MRWNRPQVFGELLEVLELRNAALAAGIGDHLAELLLETGASAAERTLHQARHIDLLAPRPGVQLLERNDKRDTRSPTAPRDRNSRT